MSMIYETACTGARLMLSKGQPLSKATLVAPNTVVGLRSLLKSALKKAYVTEKELDNLQGYTKEKHGFLVISHKSHKVFKCDDIGYEEYAECRAGNITILDIRGKVPVEWLEDWKGIEVLYPEENTNGN